MSTRKEVDAQESKIQDGEYQNICKFIGKTNSLATDTVIEEGQGKPWKRRKYCNLQYKTHFR